MKTVFVVVNGVPKRLDLLPGDEIPEGAVIITRDRFATLNMAATPQTLDVPPVPAKKRKRDD